MGWHPVAVVQYTFTHKEYTEQHKQYTETHKQYTEQHNETEHTEQNIHNNKNT